MEKHGKWATFLFKERKLVSSIHQIYEAFFWTLQPNFQTISYSAIAVRNVCIHLVILAEEMKPHLRRIIHKDSSVHMQLFNRFITDKFVLSAFFQVFYILLSPLVISSCLICKNTVFTLVIDTWLMNYFPVWHCVAEEVWNNGMSSSRWRANFKGAWSQCHPIQLVKLTSILI